MKNFNFKKGLKALGLAFLLMFSINTMNAQCNLSSNQYDVTNLLSCDVQVTVIFDACGVPGTCTSSTTVIAPSQMVSFYGTGCSTYVDDITVTVNLIGDNNTSSWGTPTSGATVSQNGFTSLSPIFISNNGPCGGGSFGMAWTTGHTGITP